MSTSPEAATAATAAPRASTNLYTDFHAQLRTRFLPGGHTEQVYQATAQAIQSGVYFFHTFRVAVFEKPAEVAAIMNSLAGTINAWNDLPGVDGLASVQIID